MNNMHAHPELREWFDDLIERRIMPLPLDSERLARLPREPKFLKLMTDFDTMWSRPSSLTEPVRAAYALVLKKSDLHTFSRCHVKFFNRVLGIVVDAASNDDATVKDGPPLTDAETLSFEVSVFVRHWSEAQVIHMRAQLECNAQSHTAWTELQSVVSAPQFIKALSDSEARNNTNMWLRVTYHVKN